MTRLLERTLSAGLLLALSSVAGCDTPRLKACDIGTESCQADVYYALARMRGDGIDPFVGVPPIRTLSREDYRKELEAEAAKQAPKPTSDGEPQVNPWDVILELLGMITPSKAPAQAAVDNQVSNVIAYYSSKDQMVTVIERPPDSDRLSDTQLLLHELVHAFQAHDVGLGGRPSSTDETFARTAIIEGEARHYEYLGVREMKEQPADDYDWAALYDGQRDSQRYGASKSSSPYFQMRWFVYPLGGYLTTAHWLAGGNGAIRSLQAHWPRSSLAFMLGPDLAAPDGLGLSCDAPDPPGETKSRGRDVRGAIQLYGFLLGQLYQQDQATPLDDREKARLEAESWALALEWRGDVLMAFFDEATQAVAGSWRFRLSSEEAASSLLDRITQSDQLRAVRDARDVVVSVSTEAALLDEFGGIEGCR